MLRRYCRKLLNLAKARVPTDKMGISPTKTRLSNKWFESGARKFRAAQPHVRPSSTRTRSLGRHHVYRGNHFMTPTQEKKLLSVLIKRLDQPGVGVLGSRFFLPSLWVALVFAFTALFQLANRGLLLRPTLVVVAASFGAVIGW